MVVGLGILPYLLPGVGISLEKRSGFLRASELPIDRRDRNVMEEVSNTMLLLIKVHPMLTVQYVAEL